MLGRVCCAAAVGEVVLRREIIGRASVFVCLLDSRGRDECVLGAVMEPGHRLLQWVTNMPLCTSQNIRVCMFKD